MEEQVGDTEDATPESISTFVQRWQNASGTERANYQPRFVCPRKHNVNNEQTLLSLAPQSAIRRSGSGKISQTGLLSMSRSGNCVSGGSTKTSRFQL